MFVLFLVGSKCCGFLFDLVFVYMLENIIKSFKKTSKPGSLQNPHQTLMKKENAKLGKCCECWNSRHLDHNHNGGKSNWILEA